jgi:SPW repeat
MPAVKIYLPRQWTDWATWLLGIWLCLSPWTLLFEYEAPAMRNAVLLGALIILVEVIELSLFRGWEEWINVAFGAWLVASTWVLGIASPAARINFVLVGALVMALALYEMWQIRHDPGGQNVR